MTQRVETRRPRLTSRGDERRAEQHNAVRRQAARPGVVDALDAPADFVAEDEGLERKRRTGRIGPSRRDLGAEPEADK